MIAAIGAVVGLWAGYRYDRSIDRHPLRSGVKRLVFWVLLFVAEYLLVRSASSWLGVLVWPVVFAYALAVCLIGPWVSEYYRRRAT
ncbi:hypothetical protein [Saccharothrix sp. NRRL B-16314]|uniref:hypothetical protein n=1 Tax=Saccharothrix sp. NRRL B-16314 TaxID=1463825 RepID=UPI0005273F12|nr:hypothetical protein [Saccharothrix sp. NRRL B-16314]